MNMTERSRLAVALEEARQRYQTEHAMLTYIGRNLPAVLAKHLGAGPGELYLDPEEENYYEDEKGQVYFRLKLDLGIGSMLGHVVLAAVKEDVTLRIVFPGFSEPVRLHRHDEQGRIRNSTMILDSFDEKVEGRDLGQRMIDAINKNIVALSRNAQIGSREPLGPYAFPIEEL